MSSPASVIDRALAWMAEDPDPDTRTELRALIDADEIDALGERFSGRLAFGTAGLRAPRVWSPPSTLWRVPMQANSSRCDAARTSSAAVETATFAFLIR